MQATRQRRKTQTQTSWNKAARARYRAALALDEEKRATNGFDESLQRRGAQLPHCIAVDAACLTLIEQRFDCISNDVCNFALEFGVVIRGIYSRACAVAAAALLPIAAAAVALCSALIQLHAVRQAEGIQQLAGQ
jgi:hypothetical protein